MADTDELGNRMKAYEGVESGRRLMPLLPAMARLDGRSFSNFTKGLNRPFDESFIALMQHVTRYLVSSTGACAGYVQSDEISLAWYSTTHASEIFFDGRVQKMTSVLAAMATLEFNRLLASGEYLPLSYYDKRPMFDCRVWNVPNITEGANTFLWRQNDCTKNSISMLAHHYFSHARLQGLHTGQMRDLLVNEAQRNWNDEPWAFKRGTFVQKQKTRRPFTTDELEGLPPMHQARRFPDLHVERTEYITKDLWLAKVFNRAEVLFHGAEPIYLSETAETDTPA